MHFSTYRYAAQCSTERIFGTVPIADFQSSGFSAIIVPVRLYVVVRYRYLRVGRYGTYLGTAPTYKSCGQIHPENKATGTGAKGFGQIIR